MILAALSPYNNSNGNTRVIPISFCNIVKKKKKKKYIYIYIYIYICIYMYIYIHNILNDDLINTQSKSNTTK